MVMDWLKIIFMIQPGPGKEGPCQIVVSCFRGKRNKSFQETSTKAAFVSERLQKRQIRILYLFHHRTTWWSAAPMPGPREGRCQTWWASRAPWYLEQMCKYLIKVQTFYEGENMKIYFCKTIQLNPIPALISVSWTLKFLDRKWCKNILTLQLPNWKNLVQRGTMINLLMLLLHLLFLAVQDSSITDIVCPLVSRSVGAN